MDLPTNVSFPSPVTFPQEFFVGVFLPQTPGDTLALMTNKAGAGSSNVGWSLLESGEWIPYASDPRIGENMANAIFPLVNQTNLGIEDPLEISGDYLIYPNPAKDYLKIKSHKNNPEPARIIICDLTGRTVYEDHIQQELSISLHSFLPGLYILRINSGSKTETHKVFVY